MPAFEPYAELSPSNFVRSAAENDHLRRLSDRLCARSRTAVATADGAARRGRDARRRSPASFRYSPSDLPPP